MTFCWYWLTFATTSLAVVACVALLLRGAAFARANLVLVIGACAAFVFGTVVAWPLHGARLALWLAAVLPAGQGVGLVASVNGMLLIAVMAWAASLFAVGVVLATFQARLPASAARGLAAGDLCSMHLGSVQLTWPELAPMEPRHSSHLRRLRLVHSTAWQDGSEQRPRAP